jgi:hypothetical protein
VRQGIRMPYHRSECVGTRVQGAEYLPHGDHSWGAGMRAYIGRRRHSKYFRETCNQTACCIVLYTSMTTKLEFNGHVAGFTSTDICKPTTNSMIVIYYRDLYVVGIVTLHYDANGQTIRRDYVCL